MDAEAHRGSHRGPKEGDELISYLYANYPKEEQDKIKAQLASVRTDIARGVYLSSAVWSLGLGLRLLSEIEKARIETAHEGDPVADPSRPGRIISDGDSLDFDLTAEQKLRAQISPFFLWRATDHFTFKSSADLLLPLSSSQVTVVAKDGTQPSRYDYRLNLALSAEYALASSETSGGEQVKLSLGWKRYFDNAPPFVPVPDRVGSPAMPVANGWHSTLELRLGIEW